MVFDCPAQKTSPYNISPFYIAVWISKCSFYLFSITENVVIRSWFINTAWCTTRTNMDVVHHCTCCNGSFRVIWSAMANSRFLVFAVFHSIPLPLGELHRLLSLIWFCANELFDFDNYRRPNFGVDGRKCQTKRFGPTSSVPVGFI